VKIRKDEVMNCNWRDNSKTGKHIKRIKRMG